MSVGFFPEMDYKPCLKRKRCLAFSQRVLSNSKRRKRDQNRHVKFGIVFLKFPPLMWYRICNLDPGERWFCIHHISDVNVYSMLVFSNLMGFMTIKFLVLVRVSDPSRISAGLTHTVGGFVGWPGAVSAHSSRIGWSSALMGGGGYLCKFSIYIRNNRGHFKRKSFFLSCTWPVEKLDRTKLWEGRLVHWKTIPL